ncbi:hypothetical protein L6452_02615 [Arctium lappa]|uniref:Uncharacterized protein n=1 Tax=Arctium lappa TaxID=4217 RepID=A0ACB9FKT6_ARCLA|nr:hypothetical protein L6452_02615 [Arctium lappa]
MISPLVEEKWCHLFGDAMATGESCVAPSLTAELVDQSVSQVEEIQDKEGGIQDKEDGTADVYNDCSQYSNRLESLDDQDLRKLQQKYGLTSSRKISMKEKVGIFLYTLALGLLSNDVSERFQRYGETISRAFHDVLESIYGRCKGFMGLARDYIRPKDSTIQCIPQHIENDSRYIPYFKANGTLN